MFGHNIILIHQVITEIILLFFETVQNFEILKPLRHANWYMNLQAIRLTQLLWFSADLQPVKRIKSFQGGRLPRAGQMVQGSAKKVSVRA